MHRLPPHVSTILFDVGNTLHHLDYALIAEIVGRHGHSTTAHAVCLAEYAAKAAVDEQFRARRAGKDHDRRFSYFGVILDQLAVPDMAREPIIADLKAEDLGESLWRVMHADTPKVIAELRRRGFTLGVVSNADGRISAALTARGTADCFTVIVDSHVVGVEKPDARIFHIALNACGARPAETIFIGDIYEIDVCGARNAGIAPVLLDPLNRYGDVDCPRITTLNELIAALQ
jgi:HAD superfamily hydrolase (TIGR01509 family)